MTDESPALRWFISTVADTRRFGANEGTDAAWNGLEAALLDGWVVDVVVALTPAVLRQRLNQMARRHGRYTIIRPREGQRGVFSVWWPADPVAASHRR